MRRGRFHLDGVLEADRDRAKGKHLTRRVAGMPRTAFGNVSWRKVAV